MPRKGYTPEQIINKLREAEVLIAQGSAIWNRLQKDWSQRLHPLPLAQRIRRVENRPSATA